MSPQRNQLELRALDLDVLLATDHPARTVWAFVQTMDLAPLYPHIRSVAGRGGAPAIDPAILVALWLWANIDSVGSARKVGRLCERDDAYRWICGGVGVNYHSLADLRTLHEASLDAQLIGRAYVLIDDDVVARLHAQYQPNGDTACGSTSSEASAASGGLTSATLAAAALAAALEPKTKPQRKNMPPRLRAISGGQSASAKRRG